MDIIKRQMYYIYIVMCFSPCASLAFPADAQAGFRFTLFVRATKDREAMCLVYKK
jgi:hypothetical protein